ncbi:efflux RND transporter periplasmic adaptor subunit [candidate division KSB1 bacterium]
MFKRFNYIVLLFTVLSVLSYLSCSEAEKEQVEIIRPVRYQPVFLTGSDRVRSFSGFAQAGQESRISFKVPGTVKKVSVKVGDNVRSGNLIAELDPKEYSLRVQQAQALEINASANYDRIRKLWENNNVSKSELDAAKSSSDAAKRSLELAQLSLSYAKLTAPVNGTISEVNVEVNENVNPGQVMVVLTSGSKTEVIVGIPEVLISQIREGGDVKVIFDAISDKTFQAVITEVGVSPTGRTSTYPVTMKLKKEDSAIRPGMAAEVEFSFEAHGGRERFIVPSHGVVEDREGRFVYVVEQIPGEEGYGIIHRKSVTIGDLTAEGLEIFEGLSDGDLVVTAGMSLIKEGKKVKM